MKLHDVNNYWKHKSNLFITIPDFCYGMHFILFPLPFSSLDAIQKFTTSLNCKVVYYFVSIVFCTFTLFIQGFLLYLLMRDLKYWKEKSLYTNIIRMLSFSWLRRFRLFVDRNNLVNSSISAFIKYVYISYARNYENSLDRSKEESTIVFFLSSKCIWLVGSLYIEMMLCGASASGGAPIWFKV